MSFSGWIGAAALCAACGARADVLFEQQANLGFMKQWGVNGFISEVNSQRLADDFVLTNDAIADTLRWNGSYRSAPGTPWTPGDQVSFRIDLFTFSGLNPNTSPFAQFSVQATVLGVLGAGYNNRPVYTFSASFPGVNLAGGVPYAVSILESDSRTSSAQFLWAIKEPSTTSVAWVFVGGVWRPEVATSASAFAFQLEGTTVPAPGTTCALLTGVGIAARRRRER
jgi:hypothetical protein